MATKTAHAPLNVYALIAGGQGQSSATKVSDALCPGLVMVSGDGSGDGVALPVASKGKFLYIHNTGTNQLATLYVYPAAGNSINAQAVNTPLVMPPQTSCALVADRLNTWHTIPVLPS